LPLASEAEGQMAVWYRHGLSLPSSRTRLIETFCSLSAFSLADSRHSVNAGHGVATSRESSLFDALTSLMATG
jgi:hypothetical protein